MFVFVHITAPLQTTWQQRTSNNYGRGGATTAPSPTASNNQLMRSMHSSGLATRVGWGGGNGGWRDSVDGAKDKQKWSVVEGQQQCWQQQQKTTINKCVAAEAEDVCGGRSERQRWLARGRAQWWRLRSDCCVAVEENQLRDKATEDGGRQQAGRAGRVVHFFSFLGGVESYLQSYPLQSYPKK